MSQENVELILGAYEAFARGDMPAVLERLADDMVLVDRILPEEPTQGREGFANQIAKIDETFDDLDNYRSWREAAEAAGLEE